MYLSAKVIKVPFSLIILLFILTACVNDNTPSTRDGLKNTVIIPVKRSPSSEKPIKSVGSKMDLQTANVCIKEEMLTKLNLPSNFIVNEELSDNSLLVKLFNPYTKKDGIYIRIVKQATAKTTLELYKNSTQFVSNAWYQIIDQCR